MKKIIVELTKEEIEIIIDRFEKCVCIPSYEEKVLRKLEDLLPEKEKIKILTM